MLRVCSVECVETSPVWSVCIVYEHGDIQPSMYSGVHVLRFIQHSHLLVCVLYW